LNCPIIDKFIGIVFVTFTDVFFMKLNSGELFFIGREKCNKRTVLSFICVINLKKNEKNNVLSDISEVGVKFLKYVNLRW
jgi:hypothetical protein